MAAMIESKVKEHSGSKDGICRKCLQTGDAIMTNVLALLVACG